MKRTDIGGLSYKPTTMVQNEKLGSSSIGRKRPGRVLIKELNENDVLQGRGSGSMQNTGNIKFRNLVEKIRPAYVATSSRKEKAKMISDMVQLIQSRKGRFLQRLCDKEVKELGLDPKSGASLGEQDHYVEMSDEEAAEKAKQAIRYVHYKKVPLEEERRKKRAADGGFLPGDNKTSSNESTQEVGYGANPLGSAPISATLANQLAQSQVPQSNVGAGVSFNPALQQSDINQLLASFQIAQTALAAQFPGNALNAAQTAQQASKVKQLASGMLPMGGNVQQQPHLLQQLAASAFANNQATGKQNANQPQLSEHQAQVNILLQGIIQQQANAQQNSILQPLLQAQQQQEQKQLNSALQTLQQQHQLVSPAPSVQQAQKPSEEKVQQQIQQQNANSIIASLLSGAAPNAQMGSALNPLMAHTIANNTPATMGVTNALLASLLSNNVAQTPTFQQIANSQAPRTSQPNQLLGGLFPSMKGINSSNTIQQQNQGLVGASSLQGVPVLAQNANALLAATAKNSGLGQSMTANVNRNRAKRPRLASDKVSDSTK